MPKENRVVVNQPTDYYSLSLNGSKLILVQCEFTNSPVDDADYHYFMDEEHGYDLLEFNEVVDHHIFLSNKYPDKLFTIHFEGTRDKEVVMWLDDYIPF